MLDQNDLQAIAQLIHESETRLYSEIHESETRLYSQLNGEIRESELRTRIFIENQVNKRLDSLYDGYKLTHEKQWELERDTESLKEQVSTLRDRLSALEKKISA